MPKRIIISVLSAFILLGIIVTTSLMSEDQKHETTKTTENNTEQVKKLKTKNPHTNSFVSDEDFISKTQSLSKTIDKSEIDSKEPKTQTKKIDNSLVLDSTNNNTVQTNTDSSSLTDSTSSTSPITDTTTTTTETPEVLPTKYLYANSSYLGKGEKIEYVRDPISVKIYKKNEEGDWELGGGIQGESAKIFTITARDKDGNILEIVSQPSNYGTVKNLTFTPKVEGMGRIELSEPLTYKALILDDGSGNFVMEDTIKVNFKAIPAEGWEFKRWDLANRYVYEYPNLEYGFADTQKITNGSSYITAVFVKKVE